MNFTACWATGLLFSVATAGSAHIVAPIPGAMYSSSTKGDFPTGTRRLPPDTLPSGTIFRVRLIDSINAGKVKPGKKLKAQLVGTIDGLEPFVVRNFSRVIGHVAQVQKRDKDHPESRLQIVFDQIRLKHRKRASFTGIVMVVDLVDDRGTMKQADSQSPGGYRDVTVPDDFGDIGSFHLYSFRQSDRTGLIATCLRQNVYLSWHVFFTVKVL